MLDISAWNGLKMSKPNKYWLGKIKLWFILHGNRRVSEYKLCSLCHHCVRVPVSNNDSRWVGYGCNRKNNYQGRLMFKRDFSDIQFEPTNYGSDWVCAEWVKDV